MIPPPRIPFREARILLFCGSAVLLPSGIGVLTSGGIAPGMTLLGIGLLLLMFWWVLRPEVIPSARRRQQWALLLAIGNTAAFETSGVLFLRTSPGDPVSEVAPALFLAGASAVGLAIWFVIRPTKQHHRSHDRTALQALIEARNGKKQRRHR